MAEPIKTILINKDIVGLFSLIYLLINNFLEREVISFRETTQRMLIIQSTRCKVNEYDSHIS